MIRRGDIYYADLNPVIGSEQSGIRPVLVVQNNIGNRCSSMLVVIPVSTAIKRKFPLHIFMEEGVLPQKSVFLAEQIRTIDRKRLRRYVALWMEG